jgi:AraC-like DNA-binding protein
MSLTFSLSDGESLTATGGIPANYTGRTFAGMHASYINSPFGQIVVQNYSTPQFCISHISINWTRPELLMCKYAFLPGIFCRKVLRGPVYEAIKGTGKTRLKSEELMALSGNRWTGVVRAEKQGEQQFINMWWSLDYAKEVLQNESSIASKIYRQVDNLPFLLSTAPLKMNFELQMLVKSLLNFQYNRQSSDPELHHLATKCLRLTLNEVAQQQSIKDEMGQTNWYNITKARKLIEYNLDQRYSTIEISMKIGVNDHKLKQLFPKLTGYKVDEYRRYKLFVAAGRKIVENPDQPLKSISDEAGYESFTSFIRAFRTLCHCTPAELREDSWNIKKVRLKE